MCSVSVLCVGFDCAVVDIGSGRLPSFDYYRYHKVISHYEPLTAKSDLNFYSRIEPYGTHDTKSLGGARTHIALLI